MRCYWHSPHFPVKACQQKLKEETTIHTLRKKPSFPFRPNLGENDIWNDYHNYIANQYSHSHLTDFKTHADKSKHI